MILYTRNDLKCFETRSDMPVGDWTGTADFVVDETDEQNAELIAKIKEYAPYFDYVTDDEGNLVDVVKTGEKPEPGPEPDPIPSDDVTWDSLAEAITEGVNEV